MSAAVGRVAHRVVEDLQFVLRDRPVAHEALRRLELLAQIGQLSAGGADDFEAFDAMADLYEDGVDAALPAAVGVVTLALGVASASLEPSLSNDALLAVTM